MNVHGGRRPAPGACPRTASVAASLLAAVLAVLAFPVGCATAGGKTWQESLDLSSRVRFVAELGRFDAGAHTLAYCRDGRLCLVDGHPVFGTEGAVPKTEVVSLAVVVDGRRVPLEHRGMFNPWSPVEGKALAVKLVEASGDELRIAGEFSDGAAAYAVEWVVSLHGSARVSIDCVECLEATCTRWFGPKGR